MTRLFIHVLFILIISSIMFTVTVFAKVPSPVLKTAQEELPKFLQSVPPDELKKLGFAESTRIEELTLGSGFQLHEMSMNDLKNLYQQLTTPSPEESQNETIFEDSIKPINTWYFPILEQGRARSLLVVDKFQGKWQVVSVGAAVLGEKLNQITTMLPKDSRYHPQLIAVNQAFSYAITIPELETPNFSLLPMEEGATMDHIFQADRESLLNTTEYLLEEAEKYERAGFGAVPE